MKINLRSTSSIRTRDKPNCPQHSAQKHKIATLRLQDVVLHECGPRFPVELFTRYLTPCGYTMHQVLSDKSGQGLDDEEEREPALQLKFCSLLNCCWRCFAELIVPNSRIVAYTLK